MIKHIWAGIYNSFKEISISKDGHQSSRWIEDSIQKAYKLIAKSKVQKTVSPVVVNRDYVLPVLFALISEKKKGGVILDFGGGLGNTFLPTLKSIPTSYKLEYHIIETEKLVEEGRKIYSEFSSIYFHEEIPKFDKSVDIVHLGSVLQYIDNWKDLIKKLIKLHPSYFLFSDLYASDIPTFVTIQKYYESQMKCRFYNINEIIHFLSNYNYKLIYKSTYVAKILGQEQESPMKNFPKQLQLGNACNLIFALQNG